ncbi:MAG: phosphoenolpyruvate--protein phosphotransferase [Candidatus Promineifilaceae bacterium]
MTHLALMAPFSGYLMPIEQVPDPVFNEKILGDGVALDPVTNALLAPCDGRIIQLHEANHALTIETDLGVEIFMHIGLNTVSLHGEGFLSHIHKGDEVTTGQTLIEFDPDYIARHALSLLTMIVVIDDNGRVLEMSKAEGAVTAAESVIINLFLNGSGLTGSADGAGQMAAASASISIPNVHGLHMRPAAVLAGLARAFDSDIRLVRGEEWANAQSVVEIMNLNIACGDAVTLEAAGPDAQAAVDVLAPAVRNGLGAEGTVALAAAASIARPEIAAPAPRLVESEDNIIPGVTASPGIAVGNIHRLRRREPVVDPRGSGDPAVERGLLDRAIAHSAVELETLQARLRAEADPAGAAVLAAHRELLHDPALLEKAQEAIDNQLSAAYAWQTAADTQAARLEQMENELLAARAADLRDIGRRVVAHLAGDQGALPRVPVNTILVAEDLTPADIAQIDRERVVGIATALGGPATHTAVLARSLDLPALAGVDLCLLDLPDGTPVILDATRARLMVNPRAEEIAYVVGMLRKRRHKRQADLDAASAPAVTTDGYHMTVLASVAKEEEAEQAVALGAEGIGLLRSEFLFMDRRSAPTEEEQAAVYASIAGTLGSSKPLIIRTLDAGGDKSLPFLPAGREANPFLGERGIRMSLDHPDLLRTQIRAILRAASAGGNIHVMFPMIATLAEWRMAKTMLDEEVNNLGVNPIPVGITVEAPAAAIMAEQFAREADFFSIGTNDLAQYVLAMDRGHPRLAPQVDALNPAVLRLIAQTAAGARKHGRRVGVCGSLASDPQAVPILLGLGIQEVSAVVPAIPTIKSLVRSISLTDSRKKARYALTLDSAAEVRALYPLEDYEL